MTDWTGTTDDAAPGMAAEPVTENAALIPRVKFSEDELRSLSTIDDLGNLFAEHELTLTKITDVLGDGFQLLDKKDSLADTPLAIVTWSLQKGDKGEFVTLRIMTKDNRKVIINDGGTGIRDQIKRLVAKGVTAPVWVPGGLRVSQYEYTDDKTGEVSRAETWYLAV